MPQFESSQVSQAFDGLAVPPMKREKGPETAGFRALCLVSNSRFFDFCARNCPKSPALSADIPILPRFSLET